MAGERRRSGALLELASETFGVAVVATDFPELRTNKGSLAALRDAVATDLRRFRADHVDEVLQKYPGSSIQVRG